MRPPHLHLHLEPGERRKRALGTAFGGYRGSRDFFRAHDVEHTGRVRVGARDLDAFISRVHHEQEREGTGYVELRLSPRRFLHHGMSWPRFLEVAHAALTGLTSPVVRAILLVNRDSPPAFLDDCLHHVVDGLPPTFVGLDLAGDECARPDTAPFIELFTAAKARGLGVTVHAGEFHDPSGIWRALDELGADRLGHAVTAAGSRSLLRRLSEDRVLVEVSITSNLALDAVPDPAMHHVGVLLDARVPFCLNSDIPLHTGCSLHDEYTAAAHLLRMERTEIDALQMSAYEHAFDRSVRPATAHRSRDTRGVPEETSRG